MAPRRLEPIRGGKFLVDARDGPDVLAFTVMLFVIERLFLERVLARLAASAPESTYRVVEWLHRLLLSLSLLTVARAVAGSIGVDSFSW